MPATHQHKPRHRKSGPHQTSGMEANIPVREVAREDLRPGDILVRYSMTASPALLGTGPVICEQQIEDHFLSAQRLLGADDVAGDQQTEGLLAFLTALFDDGYGGAALVVGDDDEKKVLEVQGGQVRATRLSDYPVRDATGAICLAVRYSKSGTVLGDAKLPAGPVLAKANHLNALMEAAPVATDTGLALLMLSVWRKCGSFQPGAIREYLLSVLGPVHLHAVESFFTDTLPSLRAPLQTVALKAADILRRDHVFIPPHFVAASFSGATSDGKYKFGRSVSVECAAVPQLQHIGPAFLSGRLQALASSLNESETSFEIRTAEHVFSLLESAWDAENKLFLTSDLVNSENSFLLGFLAEKRSIR